MQSHINRYSLNSNNSNNFDKENNQDLSNTSIIATKNLNKACLQNPPQKPSINNPIIIERSNKSFTIHGETQILNTTTNNNIINNKVEDPNKDIILLQNNKSNHFLQKESKKMANLLEKQEDFKQEPKKQINSKSEFDANNYIVNQNLNKIKKIDISAININPNPHSQQNTLTKQQQIAQQKDLQDKQLLQNYGSSILDHLICQEHNIPSNLRSKMIDWMIEVLSSYKCKEQTFFVAVRVMDMFFQKSEKVHEIQELHLVGVSSLFLACKYEEIYPMKLKTVHDKIAHQKLSIEQIKDKESEILQALNFDVIGTTVYEIFMHILFKINLKSILSQKVHNYLEKICVYLAKMILYDYELIMNKEYYVLSGSLIYVAFKIIEQIETTFKAEEQILQVIKIFGITQQLLVETASKILSLAKQFDKIFPNLENLKKFNGFSLDDESDKNKSHPPQ